MDDAAGFLDEPSGQEGGRFGVHSCADDQDDANPIVLTALEDGARHGRETVIRNLEGVYRLQHPRLSGNVSVMPGPDDGSSRVGLYLKGTEADLGIRLHAEVRSTWITLTCHRFQEPAQKAVALAAALVRLATIPGQRTVSINGDEESLGVPNHLVDYVELLEPKKPQMGAERTLALVRA
jgi:hypothetical protein